MNPKALATEISEMLVNGLYLLHLQRTKDGHDSCFSLEEVEAFCRERANNIAQALPALINLEDCGDASCQCCKLAKSQVDGTLPGIRAKADDQLPMQTLDQAKDQAQHYTNRLINRIGGRSADIKEAAVDIDKALDRLQRQMQAERAAVAAIAAEGSPAVKDAFGLYMQASDELMKEAEKMQNAAGDELRALREVVRS